MGFAEELRRAAAPIWEAILEHPYLNELASGTLHRETFRFYVQQDWLYLQEFTRTAALTAARCPDVKEMRDECPWTWSQPETRIYPCEPDLGNSSGGSGA